VGGGNASLLIAILRAHRDLHGTVIVQLSLGLRAGS
jgi:hypothetical protein